LSRALIKEMANTEADEHDNPENAEGREDNHQVGGGHTLNSFSIPYLLIIYG